MPLVSARQYARHRGVSHTAVQKAIRQGRIRMTADSKIDVEQADREWAGSTGPSPAVRARASENRIAERPQPGPSYAQSRAIRELYLARLAKLDYEERTGKLVEAAEVTQAAYDDARVVRDRLLNIPDRIASLLAVESDPSKVYEILAREIRDALIDLSTPSNSSILRKVSTVNNATAAEGP